MKYQDAGVKFLLKNSILTIQSLLFLHFLLCSIIFSFFFNLVYKPIPMFSNWTVGLLLLPSFIPVSQDFFWLLYNYLKKRHSKFKWILEYTVLFNLMVKPFIEFGSYYLITWSIVMNAGIIFGCNLPMPFMNIFSRTVFWILKENLMKCNLHITVP